MGFSSFFFNCNEFVVKMILHRKFCYLILIQTAVIEATLSSNLTTVENDVENSTVANQTDLPIESINFESAGNGFNVTIKDGVGSLGKIDRLENDVEETGNGTLAAKSEISEIFQGIANGSDEHVAETKTQVNYTCFESDSVNGETVNCNYSIVEAESRSLSDYPFLGAVDTVAIAAGFCLILAIAGYFGCVGYRRYHERKYGNSQIVARDDVYDTTDLKYFEI